MVYKAYLILSSELIISSVDIIEQIWHLFAIGQFDSFKCNDKCHCFLITAAGSSELLLHTEGPLPESTTTLALHHFHLHHGDEVRSEIDVTNNALLTTTSTSDGFTVDLTDPIMESLVDGLDVNDDRQYTVG